MFEPLQPVARFMMPQSRNDLNHKTSDVETWDGLGGTQFRCGAFFNGATTVICWSLDSWGSYLMSLGTRKDGKTPPTCVYIHNLDFDGRFIFDYIARNPHPEFIFSGQSVKIIHNGRLMAMLISYEFRGEIFQLRVQDSMNILPAGQAALEEVYLGRKEKVDVDWTKAVSDDLIEERVLGDVIGLWKIIREFVWDIYDRFHVDARKALSLATIAMSVFRTQMPTSIYNPFVKVNGIEAVEFDRDLDNLVRYGYFGGRTEVFHNFDVNNFPDNYEEFDANSLYPSQYHKPLPHGKLIPEPYSEERGLPEGEGFFIGWLYEFPSTYPVIPSKDDNNKLIYGTGNKYGVWAFPEIRYALELKAIQLIGGFCLVSDNSSAFLSDYGDRLYRERLEFRESGNIVGAFSNKLLMNSLYGKFGQSPDFEDLHLVAGAMEYDEVPLNSEIHIYKNEWYAVTMVKGKSMMFKHYMMVSVAAYITSYARVDLHRAINGAHKAGGVVTYCDTDSIHGTIPENSIDVGDELGQWKREYQGKITGAQYFLPKTYWVEHEEEGARKTTCKAKGFPKLLFREEDGTDKYTSLFDFLDILKNGFSHHKYLTFKQALVQKGRILADQMFSRTVKMVQTDKRKWMPDGRSVPLHLSMSDERLQEVLDLFNKCFPDLTMTFSTPKFLNF